MNRLESFAVGMAALLMAALVLGCAGAAMPAGPLPATQAPARDAADPEPATYSDGEAEQPAQAPGDAPAQPLIVYTGSLQLEVADLASAVQAAEALVRGMGGHVASSEAGDDGHAAYATATYRIPAERWSDALAGLRALGTRVVSETTTSEDVTAQVVDLDARLANLRVTETALQGFMTRATNIDEVLRVQRELTNVRGEIERLTAQRDALAERAALATLRVTFGVPVAATSAASEGWDLGQEIDGALASLVRIGQLGASFAIWVVLVVLPVVAPVALVLYLALRFRRRWLASHAAQGPVPPLGPAV